MNIVLKIVGVILLLIGLILTYKPNLISGVSLPSHSYETIEKRVKWGFLIGVGIFLLFHTQWDNWKLIACALLCALTLGIILARLFGFVLDGFYQKQLLWLGIELMVFILFVVLYKYANN